MCRKLLLLDLKPCDNYIRLKFKYKHYATIQVKYSKFKDKRKSSANFNNSHYTHRKALDYNFD